jgi:hypothetical protein
MTEIAKALAEIDTDARVRVLAWAANRYGIESPVGGAVGVMSKSAPGRGGDSPRYDVFVDLFDAAAPKTDAERALVGGFWLQVLEGAADFPAQQVNDALKDVGHGVGNITDAFSGLQGRGPALVRQVAKSGKSRQARKRYKLTIAGIAVVEEMLRMDRDL